MWRYYENIQFCSQDFAQTKNSFVSLPAFTFSKAKKKNISAYGDPTDPILNPPTLNFFWLFQKKKKKIPTLAVHNTLEPPGTHFARSRESPYVHSFSWRFTCKWGYVIESRVFPSICVLRHQNRRCFTEFGAIFVARIACVTKMAGRIEGAISDRGDFDIGNAEWEEIEVIEEYDHLAELLGNVLQDDEEDVQPDFARFIGESTGDSDRFQRRVTSSFTRRWSTFLSFKSLIKHRISFFCFILNLFCESLCRKQTGTEPNEWGRKVLPRAHLSGTDMK